ncbi:MAG TPA: 23S rRNA (pseudouridine(1915)-N(3))-methyltransferase RlmH [Methylocella sp.]|nr:23S rRNA (pseudouridine(1915)-N(3))-methyltransferase RlmH [Methylocella sp.]
MRVLLACVGRSKTGPERELSARYLERSRALGRVTGISGVELRELDESRAARPGDRKREEAKALCALLAPRARIIALDCGGTQLTSRAFAAEFRKARDDGVPLIALVIGGPDGLDPGFLAMASLTLSFGKMTWPHQIVRIMAAEQIYRAMAILSGHPYHRD